MSGPGVGFEYPPQKVSWLQRDLLLFANSIGAKADELHLLYVRIPVMLRFSLHRVHGLTENAGASPRLCCLSHIPHRPL